MMIQMRDKTSSAGASTSDGKSLSCEEFQAQLPEMMANGSRDHEHLKTCARCQELLEELEYIASIAGDLMQPVHEPGDNVWKGIKSSLSHIREEDARSNGHVSNPVAKG